MSSPPAQTQRTPEEQRLILQIIGNEVMARVEVLNRRYNGPSDSDQTISEYGSDPESESGPDQGAILVLNSQPDRHTRVFSATSTSGATASGTVSDYSHLNLLDAPNATRPTTTETPPKLQ